MKAIYKDKVPTNYILDNGTVRVICNDDIAGHRKIHYMNDTQGKGYICFIFWNNKKYQLRYFGLVAI